MNNTCNNNETPSSDSRSPSPLHGDILQSILSHVPLIHLLPASHVSKTWSTTVTTVTTTTTTSTTTKPWLILHTQTSRPPYPTQTHLYDPDSSSWIQIIQPSISYISWLKSSHSNLLYMISPSHLSFSSDPLHATWQTVLAPKIWRVDPVVAHVGDYVIVAGGVCDYEDDDDKLAVEVYDLNLKKWSRSNPMPEVFSQSGSATWLSVACCDNRKMFVMERSSGVTCVFDVVNNAWDGPYDMRPDPRVVYSVIGYCESDSRIIVVGLIIGENNENVIKVYGVNEDLSKCDEISEMRLGCGDDEVTLMTSFDVAMAGNVMYVCSKKWGCEEVIMCEFVSGGCKWSKVVNMVVKGGKVNVMDRMVFTCGRVGMEELRGAMRSGERKFVVKTGD